MDKIHDPNQNIDKSAKSKKPKVKHKFFYSFKYWNGVSFKLIDPNNWTLERRLW